jgi:hypothetical protein
MCVLSIIRVPGSLLPCCPTRLPHEIKITNHTHAFSAGRRATNIDVTESALAPKTPFCGLANPEKTRRTQSADGLIERASTKKARHANTGGPRLRRSLMLVIPQSFDAAN